MAIPVATAREQILQFIAAKSDQLVSETLLLIDSKYRGHRFHFGGFSVDWRLSDTFATLRRGEQVVDSFELGTGRESQAA